VTSVNAQLGELGAPLSAADLDDLAEVLRACVHDGASLGFVLPFERPAARGFWAGVAEEVGGGRSRLFAARSNGRIVGCVILQPSAKPNQRHRADIAKLLVHPRERRRGLGRRLMAAAEAAARAEGRVLLNLDTRTGDASEALYRALGFALMGVAPAYARHPVRDELEDCSFMYKQLD
jgi:ribosomal protein S18 acetylase RimI-like enzyme